MSHQQKWGHMIAIDGASHLECGSMGPKLKVEDGQRKKELNLLKCRESRETDYNRMKKERTTYTNSPRISALIKEKKGSRRSCWYKECLKELEK